MIRIPHEDGWLLIPQTAHAFFSGQLARHWGNAAVAAPQPRAAVEVAALLHDCGWYDLDRQPLQNASGEPLHFIEPQLDQVEAMYAKTVAQVRQIDPYAGVLVNRHVRVIYNSRLTHGRDPEERLRPLLDHLEQRERDTLNTLREHPHYGAHLAEWTLHHNYRIVRTCDLLSLFACGAFPAKTASDVPTKYGVPFLDMACELIAPHTLKISPYLFDQTEIVVPIQAHIIPQKRYNNPDAYRDAFAKAGQVTISLRIVQGE